MKYVIDSSVAFKWVVPESLSNKALQLRTDFEQAIHDLLAPDILPIEVGHALTRAERQKRLPVGSATPFLSDILQTFPHFHPSLAFLLRASAISSKALIGIYDCLYVALAEQEGCELVTADDKLIKKIQKDFPFTISLASLP